MAKLPSISKNVLWYVSPTSARSVVRKHFWIVTMRRAGGCFLPVKYGTSVSIPAVVNSRLGSSRGTSDALGSGLCPFDSKKRTKRSRMVALSIRISMTAAAGRSGGRAASAAVARPDFLHLLARLFDELLRPHLRLLGRAPRALREIVGAAPQIFGRGTEFLARHVSALRCEKRHGDGTDDRTKDELHRSVPFSTSFAVSDYPLAPVAARRARRRRSQTRSRPPPARAACRRSRRCRTGDTQLGLAAV